ncbi:MAG: AAA family ATPase, partial [Desulfotomaculales bacterium]
MVMFVKILSRPRKNSPKGTFFIQLGEKKGEVAKYVLHGPELKDLLVVNALFAVECELLEENTYLIYRIVDFAFTASDSDLLEAADLLGVKISADTYWKCLNLLGVKTFAEAIEAVSVPNGHVLLESLVGADAAAEFISLAAAEEKLTPYAKTSTEQLVKLFESAGLADIVDRALLWRTVKALRFRAARHRMSVADLVKKWPWVLVQAWENRKAALEVANLLAEALGAAPEEVSKADAAARAIIYLYEEANKGHCFAWKNRVTTRMMAGGLDFNTVNKDVWDTLLSKKGIEQFGGVKLLKEHVTQVAVETGIHPRKDWTPPKKKEEIVPGVYLPKIFFAEIKSAQLLPERLYAGDTVPLDSSRLVDEARKYAAEEGKLLDPDQEGFIASVAENMVVVLEGEAGTGKTYALKVLIGALNRAVPGLVPAVIAPTALAAYRAAENTVSEDAAMTVHRYAWFYEEEADLAVSPAIDLKIASQLRMPGVVIVDECSMLGPVLLQKVLSATNNGTRFVFAGDPAQLPPVGPGGTYLALIRLAKSNILGMAHHELKTNYGVKSSEVTAAACAVRRGYPLPVSSAVKVIYVRDHFEAAKKCGEIAKSITGEKYDPNKLLILTPTRTKGKAGAEILNELLARDFTSGKHLAGPYYLGTPVIARRNDYVLKQGATPEHRWLNRHPARGDVYNGTRGVIENVIFDGRTEVFVSFRKGRKTVLEPYYLEELSYFLEPAYAVTVHKAQGARAENVILVLMTALAHRSLLYTALTRCGSDRGTVTIITTKDFADAPYAAQGWEDRVLEEEMEVSPKVLSAFYHLA